MASFRAVVVHGARQVGKSTLAALIAKRIGATVVSLGTDGFVDRAFELHERPRRRWFERHLETVLTAGSWQSR